MPTFIRADDSRWVVQISQVKESNPNQMIVATQFFTYEELDAAQELYQSAPATALSRLLDLTDAESSALFAEKVCKRCGADVRFNYASGQWEHSQPVLPQYCWVDFQAGSQLHEI